MNRTGGIIPRPGITNNIIGMIVIAVILASTVIYLVKYHTEKSNAPRRNIHQEIKVVNVEKVVNAPDHYKGFFGVKGTVIKIDVSKSIFSLGCSDVCIVMPVKYSAQMPKSGSNIIVYGELKQQKDGKYFFQGKEVKPE